MGIKISDIADPVKRALFQQAAAGGKNSITLPAAVFSPHKISLVLPQKPVKRLRQSEDDCKLNKLEAAWFEHLKRTLPPEAVVTLKTQSIRLRNGNGIHYKPDFCAVVDGKLTFWETKGSSKMRGAARGVAAIKVSASLYPEFTFIFVWKKGGQWHTQRVLP